VETAIESRRPVESESQSPLFWFRDLDRGGKLSKSAKRFVRDHDVAKKSTWLLLAVAIVVAPARAKGDGADTFFEVKIRPALAGTCFKCHGGEKVSNGLRVDSREALVKGGKHGPAIIPGDPDKSLLVQAIRRMHAEIKMPPDRKLPAGVIANFAAWVKAGADWPRETGRGQQITPQRAAKKHWAFEPVRKVTPPYDASGWTSNPIDRFIQAKRHAVGLKPVGSADKRVLLRRVTFDLIGLPPTPDDMKAFLVDESPGAFAKVVDRLLASPQYGERWGRHWMDVARYADTAGDNADYPIPEARLFRDYIIDAFNADKPYDQFVREQLAGDILAKKGPRDKYAERVIATGFLALSRRYATAPYELWNLTLEDTIETTGRAFMGLTLRCARCHDHKFDPVTKEDYYGLYGIFASTQFPWAGGEEFHSMKRPREHFVPVLPEDAAGPRWQIFQAQAKQLGAEIQSLEVDGPLPRYLVELDQRLAAKSQSIQQLEARRQNVDALKAERATLQRERDRTNAQIQARLNPLRERRRLLLGTSLPDGLPGAYAVQEGTPVDAYIQVRGEVDERGPVVKRGVPKFLTGDSPLSIPANSSGRLQLADWLTRPENPLTARVMVNRIWQHHFGKGIVGTPSNFGLRGEPPTHPELLDWLAARFVDSGWSVKALHRLILLSRTYQLASSHDDATAAKDPSNRWYWRYDRRRLDAEQIRDALLTVSGKLDTTRPGPHPFPPIDKWVWTQHNPFKEVYASNHRSVYLMTQRFQRHPYLALFDGPDTNTTTARRPTSTVPLQALFLINNPFMREQAQGFARRLIAASADRKQRVELAHLLAWSRPATAKEIQQGLEYMSAYEKELARIGAPRDRLELEAWTSYARVLISANEFVYLD
jgi:hypothetical protein